MNAKDLIKKAESLQGSRSNFETEWQNVADYFRPTKANVTVERSQGDKSHIQQLYESAPINFVYELKSIVIGILFNRSIKPINIKSENEELNENQAIKDWIADFTDMLLAQMFNPKSNFERALSEAVADDIAFGTMATLIEEGKEFPLRYTTLNIKNFLIAENDEGVVDYVIIKDKKTARQIVSKWGDNPQAQISEKITKALETEPFKEFELQLHILPRKERDKNKIDRLNKKIAGYWVDVENNLIIEEIGWDSMPVAVGRSEKATGEMYGTSRAMIALPDARQLNQMSKIVNEASELAIRPPLNVNATYTKRINLRAGALNSPDAKTLPVGRAAIEPIITTGNIPLTQDLIARKEQNIREVFFLDKLKIFDDARATATQILELRAESLRIMGDFTFGVIDYIEQLLDRSFNIIFNKIYFVDETNQYQVITGNGLFTKPFPKELAESPNLKINYQNPITQAQKLNEATAIEKLIANMANLAQIKPEVFDLLDSDKVVRKYSDILSVDPDIIKDKILVMKERQVRQQQMEQQQALDQEQQAMQTASMAKQSKLI